MRRDSAECPAEGLSHDYDWNTLYRLHMYLWREYRRANEGWRWPWQMRRANQLGTALDVLSDLSRELKAQGTLRSPTMFSEPSELTNQHVKLKRRTQ